MEVFLEIIDFTGSPGWHLRDWVQAGSYSRAQCVSDIARDEQIKICMAAGDADGRCPVAEA